VETSDERYAGYAEAMAEQRIALQPALVKNARFLQEKSFEATRELLQARNRPTAIFVCNELMASGCIHALKEARLRIPQDISFISFDDTVWAEYLDPPITCVSQPSYSMGMLAFDYLLGQIHGHRRTARPQEEVVMKTRLVIRGSCAKINGA